MKKYLKILLAFIMTFAIFTNANAKMTGTFSITINNEKAGHNYEAYQIFAGDVSEAGNNTLESNQKVLSNITWGTGVREDFKNLMGDARTYANAIASTDSNNDAAKELAKVLAEYLSGTVAGTSTYANGKYTINNLPAGYYLVKDADGTVLNKENDAATEFIIRIADNISIEPKFAIPTAEKKIIEDNSKLNAYSYAVKDIVNYELKGTLPSNYDYYKKYKYVFHDTLSNGLTLKQDSIHVYVKNGTTETEITTGFNINKSNHSFDIEFTNLKEQLKGSGDSTLVEENVTKDAEGNIVTITSSSEIYVRYDAEVNEDAVKGIPGNDNTLIIEFSNNPGTNETGKTTPEIVKVYVFDLKFNKIGSDTQSSLAGATFELYREENRRWVKVGEVENPTDAIFIFEGISAGRNSKYKLVESVTPDGYNTVADIIFTVNANYKNENGLEVLDTLTVNSTETNEVEAFTVKEPAEGEEKTLSTIITTVTDIKGINLPLTGGIGTTIFTVIGITLMGIAIVSFIKNKKEGM